MSMELPLSQSPRTQAFQMPPAPEDEKDLFTQSFSQLAYSAFQKTQPELLGSVITFRVLDVDVDDGLGIGAFILHYDQDILFVPCVVADNAIKPLDSFYSRSADRFYPFTTSWLREATKANVNQLGTGVKPPKTMPTDVDIRNLVVPPTTGRYSYASAQSDDAWLPFISALKKEKTAEVRTEKKFLEFLARTPDGTKVAFANLLSKNVKLANTFAEFYGAKPLTEALSRREKIAQEHRKEVKMKQDVFVMTNATPVQEIKRELKPEEAALAFSKIRLHGFYVKDDRKTTDDLVSFAETDLHLTQPTDPGVYNVYMANGTVERVIIIPGPMCVHRKRSDEARIPQGYYYDDRNREKGLMLRRGFLVLFKDGRYAKMDDMVAEAVMSVSHAEVQKFLEEMTKATPGNNEQGVLISASNLTLRATDPFWAEQVTSKDGTTVFKGDYHHTVILNPKMKGNKVYYPQDQDTLMFGDSYRWFNCKKQLTNSEILASPGSVFRLVEHRLEKNGAERVLVKKAGSEFIVGGDGKPVSGYKAVEKIARRYNLRVKEAAEIITVVGSNWPVSLWRTKRAQGESLDPNAPPPDPSQMAPQGPPPPSGLDLATNEKMQQIDAQIAALTQMKQVLQEVQQRAGAIDQGGGAAMAPGAAATMAAGPGSMGGQPPMTPAPMGGAPAPQGAPPPDMSQAMAPGGGPQPIGAPPGPPQPPPPPPVMTEETPSAQNLEQQVNPDFLQEAASLQDEGIFDATAISSLAKQRNLKDLLQNYMPAIENSMDNTGRVLLLFYMKEPEIKRQIGSEAFEETEQKIRDVFKGLGDAVLAINQYSDQISQSA